MATRRKDRLADQIRDEVSRILLYEMNDPRMGFVTVIGVDLAGDLKTATIKVSVMGDERDQAVTMKVIQHARGYVQRELGARIRTRFLPVISFEADDSVKRSVRLSKTLRSVLEDSDAGREQDKVGE